MRNSKAFSLCSMQTRSHFSFWIWSYLVVFQHLKNNSQQIDKCLHKSNQWSESRCLPRMEFHQKQFRPQLCVQKNDMSINTARHWGSLAGVRGRRPVLAAWLPRLMRVCCCNLILNGFLSHAQGEGKREVSWGGIACDER